MTRETVEFMRERLAAAQQDRDLRADWVRREQLAMRDAVNEVRARLGLGLVEHADIVRIETSALGHVDYSIKFALYCAELAEGKGHRP